MANLYIGLGGTGLHTISAIKQKLSSWNFDDNSMHKSEFLYIDREIITSPVNLDDHEMYLMDFTIDWEALCKVKSPDHERFFEWIDEIILNQILSKPSKELAYSLMPRMSSRTLLFNRRFEFMELLDQKISSLLTMPGRCYEDEDNIHVITIINSSCGATGSGIILDLLFYLWCSISRRGLERNKFVIVTYSAMPELYLRHVPYGNIRRKKIHLNTYSCLRELQAIIKDSCNNTNTCFQDFSAWLTNNVSEHFAPINSAYLINGITDSGKIIQEDSFYKVLGELILFLGFTDEIFYPGFGKINEEQFYSPVFSAAGYINLLKPKELLTQYIGDRLYFELIQEGIIGRKQKIEDYMSIINSFEFDFVKPALESFESFLQPRLSSMESEIMQSNKPEEVIEKYIKTIEETDFYWDDPDLGNFAQNLFEELEAKIKQQCYEICNSYTLNFALEYFSILDDHYDRLTIEKSYAVSFDTSSIRKGFFQYKTDRKKVLTFLNEFQLAVLSQSRLMLYKKLSFANIGYFDDCKIYIRGLISMFDLLCPAEWDKEIKRAIIKESYNPFRIYLPPIDKLINSNGQWLKANYFESQYVKLIDKNRFVFELKSSLQNDFSLLHPKDEIGYTFEKIEDYIRNFIHQNIRQLRILNIPIIDHFENLINLGETESGFDYKFFTFNDVFLPLQNDKRFKRLMIGKTIPPAFLKIFSGDIKEVNIPDDEIIILVIQHQISLAEIIGFKYIEEDKGFITNDIHDNDSGDDFLSMQYFQPFIHRAFSRYNKLGV